MTQEQQTQLSQLEETIRQAQQQIEELKSTKPKKFEWKYPIIKNENFNAFGLNITTIFTDYRNIREYIEHGRYRITEEVAEQSLARNKRANRLEALAEQLGGLKEFEHGNNLFYVYRDYDFWTHAIANFCFQPEIVYMTKECAIEICRMLNSNEFSLEGEL